MVVRHQDIILPQRIHADSRSAVKIEGCARDDDTGKGSPKKFENKDEWLVTYIPLSGIAPFRHPERRETSYVR